MRCLVTGGAGYIGSHVAQALIDSGHKVTVLDNLSTGHIEAIPKGASFERLDLIERDRLNNFLTRGKWDVALHFAALSLVGESVTHPYYYLKQNLITSINLIEACVANNIKKIIFSSTAALFDNTHPSPSPIKSDSPINPASPYGESKFFVEKTLKWAEKIHNLRYASLRYFNAAGADPLGRLGEDHQPETHLLPIAIDAALGRRPPLRLFGTDYPTPDGSCIRDYIHVSDLADAHLRAISQINNRSVTYNLGNGRGFSNLEIIKSVERVSGRKVPWIPAERRLGDPPILIADSTEIKKETGWTPRFSDIDEIVRTAFTWREKHPDGYRSP
ncbi:MULTISPECIES: UDP-glucose 4-epimerase GalE [Bombella]|uniref:UDP-glucose 4-epimerase n=1 Tax=Bombella mellum TaxID=2039288 RepID=A0ABR5ZRW0_9PROT|nr:MULTISPECIES: UDP-glucose 4-epimerase GalE [Bombella]MBA5726983.1 UDP-glucose 4-epimerase GalE [Bombella mellum]MPW00389.1 UDP-glucose 4-epimerase GalE [Bombella apis]